MAENKKLALLRVYDVLRKRTDENHPMTQAEMIDALRREYGIDVDRRTIARTLLLLREAGVEIESSRRGSWLPDDARPFTKGELQMLIDSVLSSYYIPRGQTEELIEKLCALSSDEFRSRIRRRASASAWEKTESQTLFLNVEIITEAIEKGRQIRFTWLQRGTDKKLHPLQEETVTPLRLFSKKDRYFLFALLEDTNEKTREMLKLPVWTMTYNLDEMQNVEILNAPALDPKLSPLFPNGFSIEALRRVNPDMEPIPIAKPKLVRATLVCIDSAIGLLMAWFGKDVRIEKMPALCGDGIDDVVWETLDPSENFVKATVLTTESSVRGFLRRYGGFITLLSPQPLLEEWISLTQDNLKLMQQISQAAQRAENGTQEIVE